MMLFDCSFDGIVIGGALSISWRNIVVLVYEQIIIDKVIFYLID